VAKRILGVLASGRGSNLVAIINAINAGKLNAEIAVVISDNPNAAALSRAEENGIAAVCVDRKHYSDKFEDAILGVLGEYRVNLLVLAGFMRILSSRFINEFPGHIMNIHPSLLPSFPGLNAQKQALEWGVKISGCTVHFVDEGVDTGPIIMQKSVPILENDTVDTLSSRILSVEHIIYPVAIGLYCDGLLEIKNGKVIIKNGAVN
jgi:phosphoribosylglycinamide formyltransferase-1